MSVLELESGYTDTVMLEDRAASIMAGTSAGSLHLSDDQRGLLRPGTSVGSLSMVARWPTGFLKVGVFWRDLQVLSSGGRWAS